MTYSYKKYTIESLCGEMGLSTNRNHSCLNKSGHTNGDKNPSARVFSDGMVKCFGCGLVCSLANYAVEYANYLPDFEITDVDSIYSKPTDPDKKNKFYKVNIKPKKSFSVQKKKIASPKKKPANPDLIQRFLDLIESYIVEDDWKRVIRYFQSRCLDLAYIDDCILPIPLNNHKAFNKIFNAMKDDYYEELIDYKLFNDKGRSRFAYYDFFILYKGSWKIGMPQAPVYNLQAGHIKKDGEDFKSPKYLFLSNCRDIPFNWHKVNNMPKNSTIYLTEGAITALSLHKMLASGNCSLCRDNKPFCVSSNGSQKVDTYLVKFFKDMKFNVRICFDNDESGRKGASLFASVFESQGIKYEIIDNWLPDGFNDYNDYLVAYNDIF